MISLTAKFNLSAFERLAQRLSQPASLFEAVDKNVREEITDQLETGRNESRWKPLSPRYAKRKAKQFPGKPILVRTGRLLALYGQPGRYDHLVYRYGPDDKIAIKHHLGIGLPARPLDYSFAPLVAGEELKTFVRDAIKGAGL